MQNANVTKIINSSNNSSNSSSNFNLMDKKMDTSLPEELIPEVFTTQSASAVDISVMDQCDKKSLEDKVFLYCRLPNQILTHLTDIWPQFQKPVSEPGPRTQS